MTKMRAPDILSLFLVNAAQDNVGGSDDGGHLPAVAQRARHAGAPRAARQRRGHRLRRVLRLRGRRTAQGM